MIISRQVKGIIRSRRYFVESILGIIYILIPWLNWENKPLMRLNIPERKFQFMGSIFIPQEGIYLLLFLLTMGLSLFFFTSLIGRVWCGWACPQTVFTDFFDVIGRIILGDKYGKKDASQFKKIVLHLIWIIFSFIASFHIISYFQAPKEILNSLIDFTFTNKIFPYFLIFFTFTLYIDMVFIREQFCKYACPYAKFQTVLMDSDTFNVTYDYKRGEPRRNKKIKIGDCTACNMCLVVCPTGIDIREGLNVGCIACGKCVDACKIQMSKENKKSLIGYYSLNQIETNQKIKWIRPRTIAYFILLILVLLSAIFLLKNRIPIYLSILPDRNIPPLQVDTNTVRNFYNLQIKNISYNEVKLKFELEKYNNYPLKLLIGNENSTIELVPEDSKSIKFIIESPNHTNIENSKITNINLNIFDLKNQKKIITKSIPLRFTK